MQRASLFGNFSPFVDDMCPIKDHLEIQKKYKDIPQS